MENKSLTCHTTSERRLIDANLLVSDLAHSPDYSAAVFQKIAKIVHDSPTVDAVPVVHARWHDVYLLSPWVATGVCGHCKLTSYINPDFPHAKHCQHCGAKMDGGNEDG